MFQEWKQHFNVFEHNGHLTSSWICQQGGRSVGQKECQNCEFYVASGIISTTGQDQKKFEGKIKGKLQFSP